MGRAYIIHWSDEKYKIIVGKERPRHRWEDIKMNLRKTGCKNVD